MKQIKMIMPGLGVCLGIACCAWLLGCQFPLVGGPVFSILSGMLITIFWKEKKYFQPGIAFTSKKILQYAVILLGFGMNLSSILKTGQKSFPIILSTITISLLISFLMCRLLQMDSKISILIGVGSSICGGSAIAATAPVIDAGDEEIAQSISVIFLFNVLAALIFPTLGTMLGLSNEGFGLFAGTAVNDTSSVTAAAAAWDGMHGSNTLDIATIVKLTRTLAIIPITLGLAAFRSRKTKGEAEKIRLTSVLPMFVIFFVLASVVTTIFSLSPAITHPLKELSKFFIIMAMSAIGLNTNLVKLVKSGAKPILMGLCCWGGIAVVSLTMQSLLGIW